MTKPNALRSHGFLNKNPIAKSLRAGHWRGSGAPQNSPDF